jgi:phosphoribosylformylglycinamidine synthase
MVGLIEDAEKTCGPALSEAGLALLLLGETRGALGQSLYLREVLGREEGAPPPVDLAAERRAGELVQRLIAAAALAACHDLSDGGLLVGLAEMALAGGVGAEIAVPELGETPLAAWLFGEDQGRYIVAVKDAEAVLKAAAEAGVPASRIGASGGDALTLPGRFTISLAQLRRAHENWFPEYMAGELA